MRIKCERESNMIGKGGIVFTAPSPVTRVGGRGCHEPWLLPSPRTSWGGDIYAKVRGAYLPNSNPYSSLSIRKTRENLELHVVSHRHGLPRCASTLAPLGEGLQDQLLPTPMRDYMSAHFLSISGSFAKIGNKTCFHGASSWCWCKLCPHHRCRCDSATREHFEDVIVQGNTCFPSFSCFPQQPFPTGDASGSINCEVGVASTLFIIAAYDYNFVVSNSAACPFLGDVSGCFAMSQSSIGCFWYSIGLCYCTPSSLGYICVIVYLSIVTY